MSNLVWTEAKGDWCQPGIHEGVFTGFENLEAKGDYKEALQFKFEANGKMTGNIGAIPPTPKNIAGRLIRGLLDKTPTAGDDVKAELTACIGKSYTLVVQKNRTGRAVVVQVAKKK